MICCEKKSDNGIPAITCTTVLVISAFVTSTGSTLPADLLPVVRYLQDWTSV